MSDLHDAAFRAGVWQFVEQRAHELKDQAKAELAALPVGDTIAGKYEGHVIAKATMTKGKTGLRVTDETKLLEWVAENHPTEIVQQVNPAFLKALEARAKSIGLGAVVNHDGQVVPGVEIVEGSPSVTVRRDKDAFSIIAQLLSSGRLSVEGIKELTAEPGEL